MRIRWCLVAVLGMSSCVVANPLQPCIDTAATSFQVPALVIETVLQVEGGTAGVETRHRNGAVDIGPAQINIRHLPALAKLDVSRDRLRDDACLNVAVAAWHLRRDFDRTDPAQSITARWVSAMLSYHSPTPRFRARYARRLDQALRRSNSHGG